MIYRCTRKTILNGDDQHQHDTTLSIFHVIFFDIAILGKVIYFTIT